MEQSAYNDQRAEIWTSRYSFLEDFLSLPKVVLQEQNKKEQLPNLNDENLRW